MRFFVDARFTPGADPDPRMEDEKRRVGELRDEGFIEQLFRRLDGTGAYLVVSADSPDAVHEQLDTLPFVETGIMTMQVDEIETL
jgi:muconolactone delta-isomerase